MPLSSTVSYTATSNQGANVNGGTGLIYDAAGNVIADPLNSYPYDAEGARIAKGTLSAAPSNSTSLCAPPLSSGFTLSARYLVDQGGDQVTEINGAGQWQHSNVFSAARLTATYDYNSGNGGLHFELADPLGTKRVQANIYGQIEMSWASLPFGDAPTTVSLPGYLPCASDITEQNRPRPTHQTPLVSI
jgi:hypothetical protein